VSADYDHFCSLLDGDRVQFVPGWADPKHRPHWDAAIFGSLRAGGKAFEAGLRDR
jgi:hypothetical protein